MQLLTVVIAVEINRIGCCSVILDWAPGANQELEIAHSDGFRDIQYVTIQQAVKSIVLNS